MSNDTNAVGFSISEAIKNWKPTAELAEVEGLRFSNHPSPWGSIEYGMTSKNKTRRVWINDYVGQLFIEVRFNKIDGDKQHTQRFHFMISDERRVVEDIIRFFLYGFLPEYNPAKKQYVAYLNTPDAAVRKASVLARKETKEKMFAEKQAEFEAKQTDANRKAAKPKEKKAEAASVQVFSSPAATEEIPAWKKALTSLTDLGMAFRTQKANQ